MAKSVKWIIIIFVLAFGLAATFYFTGKSTSNQAGPASQNQEPPAASSSPSALTPAGAPPSVLAAPISNWQSRVTKKPFGIYITPANSPVQPEKFTGYHTGVDFETLADEQNVGVPIYAICSGPLKVKERASGYGGVAVQSCKLEGQDITVIYGHLRLSSIAANAGQELSAGEKLAVLGTGFDAQTDGERKHLHLGIHKGTAINILGYVQEASQLDNWIDVIKYLK